MRCNRASIFALITHPKYSQNQDLLRIAAAEADGDIRKHFEFAAVSDLPASQAAEVIGPHLPKILKTQRSNGLWKIEDSERKSFWLLRALGQAVLLQGLLDTRAFRYDPLAVFQRSLTLYGYVIRREFSKSPLESDEGLGKELVKKNCDLLDPDGSWGHTIVVTCKRLEELCWLGVEAHREPVQKAAEWLFSMYNPDLTGFSVGKPYGIPGHAMFSTPDRWAEFQSALQERPEWDPKQLCYNHLAMIQNGIAIQTLIRLGYPEDDQIVKACDNLFYLKEKYGGWCQSNIHNAYLSEM